MKKNRLTIGILTMIVFSIWVYIGYKVYSIYTNDNTVTGYEADTESQNSFQDHFFNRDTLSLNYSDPFLKVNKKEMKAERQRKRKRNSNQRNVSFRNVQNDQFSSGRNSSQNAGRNTGHGGDRRATRYSRRYSPNDGTRSNARDFEFPENLIFKGTVINRSGNEAKAIIELENRDIMVGEGTELQGLYSIKSITPDSIVICEKDSVENSKTYYFDR